MIAARKWRRFRFGMRTLLFLPVLVGGVWWWSTWPERTARRFVRLLTERDVQAVQGMLATPRPAAETAFDMWGMAERGEGRFNQWAFNRDQLLTGLLLAAMLVSTQNTRSGEATTVASPRAADLSNRSTGWSFRE